MYHIKFLIFFNLLELVFSTSQQCKAPRANVGDTNIKNCKLRVCKAVENKVYGKWRTVKR